VETEFIRILNETEKECLKYGGEEIECFEQGLEEASATAGDICHDHVEGTSWFFFTMMMTIGYGNQAPITDEGRLWIYIAGITSLIFFAGLLLWVLQITGTSYWQSLMTLSFDFSCPSF